ncbi:RNA-directed DNA polymerase, eukaryota, reverse transcriptase zinc-binding domain protein [Tanacetum coccineum]
MPMEAWTNEGINAIASCIGKPKIMDSMTSYVCKNRLGRTEFVRVLVEIEAVKGFKNEVEIQYRDKDQGIKGTKKVKVEYDWKAPLCSHCKVFGHNFDQCTKRVKTAEELAQKEVEEKKRREELEFQVVLNRSKRNVRNAEVSKQGIPQNRYMGRRVENQNKICQQKHNGSKIVLDKEKGQNQSNKERSFDEEFHRLTKQNNHNSKNKEIRESSNKFSVLNRINDDDIQDLNMLKDKMLVDKYLNIKIHPSTKEMKNWSMEMREYFKRAWDIKNVTVNVINGRIFGQWEWVSNARFCMGGCRIVVGWNPVVVRIMVIHESKQQMLCLIENIKDHSKVFCSFIYASNSSSERRELWKELDMDKNSISDNPWIQMGDFNVFLYLNEHTAGRSTIDGDMQEFMKCVNSIRIEDVCSSGLHFTWFKSPSSPTTIVMKKLDGIMANEKFIGTYSQAFAIFHPFLVSDHSPAVLVIPNAMSKKKRSFKFANFVAEKENFLPKVEQSWNEKVNGCSMFKVVKMLKMLKVKLKNLAWKNGNIFDNVVILREKLKDAQNTVNDQPYDNERKRIAAVVLNDYNEAMTDEDKLLFQMAKVEWLNEGDMSLFP